MSCCWNCCCCCPCRRRGFDRDEEFDNDFAPIQAQSQRQRQVQVQAQAQALDADQDSNQKSVFKEIGNVHIKIENENIAVLALLVLAFLDGDLDSAALKTALTNIASKQGVSVS